MLIGEYIHTMDSKHRLSLPSKFRKELGKVVVVTRGFDHCLFIYSRNEWKKFTTSLGELSMGQSDSRALNRFLLGGAVEVEVDHSGRILVPDFLTSFAGLDEKVIVTGVNNRVELWDEKAWRTYTSTVEKQADALAERLGDIGMV